MHKQLDTTSRLGTATIDWRDGTPVSRHYDDIYYSRADGLDEARHVFLHHNGLPQRWQRPEQANAHFIIIESGFGTGLNFLATWSLWRQTHAPGQSLHYVSIEKHPVEVDAIARIGQHWPQLHELCASLCAVYPPALPGLHPLQLEDRLQLTLGFGDIVDILDQLGDCTHPAQRATTSIKADCWYLDGFAPARNPAMWSSAVFARMAALSKPGTHFATFTAAGAVRRGLGAVGFAVRKVAGYDRKREMLCGEFDQANSHIRGPEDARPHEISIFHANSAASMAVNATDQRRRATNGLAWHTGRGLAAAPNERHALVIGAGLAGCHTARALADSGWRVTVLERAERSAAAASGNPLGILYSRLSSSHSEQADFYLASYLIACRHYRRHFANGQLVDGEDGELSGLLQLAYHERERQQLDALAERFADHPQLLQPLSAGAASERSGVALEHPALLFAHGGWLRPRRVCQQLLQHPRISLHTAVAVDSLHREAGAWQVHGSAGERFSAPVAIVCGGLDSAHLEPLRWLPTRPVGGQITLLPRMSAGPETPAPREIGFFARPEAGQRRPRLPLCHDGYVAALPDGTLCCGASFRVNDAAVDLRQHDHRHNLAQLATHIPALLDPAAARDLGAGPLAGRASVRCTSPDYLPIVGPVPDIAALRTRFEALGKDARRDVPHGGAFIDGLFVNTGHGAKGLATTPVAAALLTAQLNGTPRPLPWQLVRAISPARFVIRDLIKGRPA